MALQISTHPFPPFQPSPPAHRSTPDSITLTPRSSFYTTISHSTPPNSSTRPSSFSSIDSGYASTVGPQSDFDPMLKDRFGKKRLSPPDADLCRPDTPTSHSSAESPKPKRVLFLQRRRKSPGDTPSEPFPRTSWHRANTDETGLSSAEDEDDDNMQRVHSPATAFQAQYHFATRRGMIHHSYPPEQAPYMQAYDRTLLDK